MQLDLYCTDVSHYQRVDQDTGRAGFSASKDDDAEEPYDSAQLRVSLAGPWESLFSLTPGERYRITVELLGREDG